MARLAALAEQRSTSSRRPRSRRTRAGRRSRESARTSLGLSSLRNGSSGSRRRRHRVQRLPLRRCSSPVRLPRRGYSPPPPIAANGIMMRTVASEREALTALAHHRRDAVRTRRDATRAALVTAVSSTDDSDPEGAESLRRRQTRRSRDGRPRRPRRALARSRPTATSTLRATHHQGFYEVGAIGVAALDDGVWRRTTSDCAAARHRKGRTASTRSTRSQRGVAEQDRTIARAQPSAATPLRDDLTAATAGQRAITTTTARRWTASACDARTGTCEAMDASVARPGGQPPRPRRRRGGLRRVGAQGRAPPHALADAPAPPSAAGGDGGGGSWVPGTYAAFHGESECWHCVLPFKGA